MTGGKSLEGYECCGTRSRQQRSSLFSLEECGVSCFLPLPLRFPWSPGPTTRVNRRTAWLPTGRTGRRHGPWSPEFVRVFAQQHVFGGVQESPVALFAYLLAHSCNNTGLGVGLNFVVTTLLQQFRVVERLRFLLWHPWEHDAKKAAPLRLPGNLTAQGKDKDLVTCEHGCIRVLVSDRTAPTNHLHMSLVILKPGCEIPPLRAASLEVYTVLAGSGMVSQQGVVETSSIGTGQAWVVDPGCFRWVSNRNGSTDLVLLRTTDRLGPYALASSAMNRIRPDPNRRTTSSMAALAATTTTNMGSTLTESMRQVQQMASDYVQQQRS
jgi:quercetin dioxygenase-like cupin family protein